MLEENFMNIKKEIKEKKNEKDKENVKEKDEEKDIENYIKNEDKNEINNNTINSKNFSFSELEYNSINNTNKTNYNPNHISINRLIKPKYNKPLSLEIAEKKKKMQHKTASLNRSLDLRKKNKLNDNNNEKKALKVFSKNDFRQMNTSPFCKK